MSEHKKRIIELLKRKGIDPVELERKLMAMLRKGSLSTEIRDYIKNIVKGGEK